MGAIIFTLPAEEGQELRIRAKSLGLTVSAYMRRLIKESSRRHPDAHHAEILKFIRALAPTLAEAFGRTQNVSNDQTQRLAQTLLERFDQEVR